MTDSALSPEILAAQAASVRQMAFALVRDPADADDALQDAWLEAVQRPTTVSNPRAWLSAVVRNAEKRAVTSQVARRRREARAARPEALDDTTLVAERVRLQRDLATHVLALDEPYRSTILLRFFDELSVKQIAERTGRPVNTVRTHVERGLARLRERLDGEYGERSAWALAFLPVALPTGGEGAPVGAVEVGRTAARTFPLRAALGALALTAASSAVWLGLREPALRSEPATPSSALATPRGGARDTGSVDDRAPIRRATELEPDTLTFSVFDDTEAGPDAVVEVVAADGVARGRVLGIDGHPVPGVELELVNPDWPVIRGGFLMTGKRGLEVEPLRGLALAVPGYADRLAEESGTAFPERFRALLLGEDTAQYITRSTAAGSWSCEIPTDATGVLIRTPEWKEVAMIPSAEHGTTLVVARSVRLHGSVIDVHGTPLEGLDVGFGISSDGIPGFPGLMPAHSRRGWQARTDAAGAFVIEEAPYVPGVMVTVNERGWKAEQLPLPEDPARALEFVLEPRAARPRLSGTVVFPDGTPAAEAFVTFGQDNDRTDADGYFELERTSSSRNASLTASLEGIQAAVDATFGERLWSDPELASGVVLTLGPPALTLSGRVVDGEGEPLAGLLVALPWATPLGTFGGQSVETFAARGFGLGDDVVTDAEGRFRLEGLRAREYRVRVVDPRTGLIVESAPTFPSDDLVLRVPSDAFVGPVEVRVLSSTGTPVEGAQVALGAVIAYRSSGWTGRRTELGQTGADGALRLDSMPWRHAYVDVSGPGIEAARVELETRPGGTLSIEVALLYSFRVEVPPDAGVRTFEVLDADGEPLLFETFRSDVRSTFRATALDPENLPLRFEVTDAARTLRLSKDGVELERRSLVLVHGELNVLAL